MEVKINTAKRTGGITLAENNGHVLVQGNAMAKLRSAAFVGFYGLCEEGNKGSLEFIRRFINANDVFIIHSHSVGQFLPERFNSHTSHTRVDVSKSEAKNQLRMDWNVRPGRHLHEGAGAKDKERR